MDMSSSSSMSSSNSMSTMSSMTMVFTTDHSTPLFSSAWTPTTAAAYAGTCIFLVVLALISRGILAFRHIQERRWSDKAVKRRYVTVAGESEKQALGGREADEVSTLTTKGLDEKVRVVRSPGRGVECMPWRFSTDLPRACIFVVLAGVNYLLMLAVMTLNVGYFLSVLAGLFVGELALGRYGQLEENHH